jgi:hypothetical protein
MLAAMVVLRKVLTVLLAFALASATGWASCASDQHRPTMPVPTIGSHHGHEHAMAHDRHPPDTVHASSVNETGEPESSDHACPKCCGVCVMASSLPNPPSSIVAPAVSRALFVIQSEQLRGRIVLVDPDIPKQVV